jgi:hypothetical protein
MGEMKRGVLCGASCFFMAKKKKIFKGLDAPKNSYIFVD